MLVLTRRLMEKLYIGDDICVTVVRVEGGQVRLGIEAPRQIPVVRAELRPEDRRFAPTPGRVATGNLEPTSGITTRPASPRGTDSRPRGPSR